MINQSLGPNRNNILWTDDPWCVKQHIEIGKQKKTTSWAPNDEATDKTKSSPNQLR